MKTHHIDRHYPTPYRDLNRVLHEFTDGVRTILRTDFVGAYLQGSFAVGDFDLHSDVDFCIIIAHELTEQQIELLQELQARLYHLNSRWAKHLEGSYFPKALLCLPPQPGDTLWYLDNGAHSLERSDHCNTLLVRHVLREHGITLAGPSLDTLIPPVTPSLLRREIISKMTCCGEAILQNPASINNRFYQAYAVLNYCRMLHDLHCGYAGSKLAGAEWMIYNGFAKEWDGLIERSWARRSNPANWIGLPADPDDFAATLAFIRHVLKLAHRYMMDAQEDSYGIA